MAAVDRSTSYYYHWRRCDPWMCYFDCWMPGHVRRQGARALFVCPCSEVYSRRICRNKKKAVTNQKKITTRSNLAESQGHEFYSMMPCYDLIQSDHLRMQWQQVLCANATGSERVFTKCATRKISEASNASDCMQIKRSKSFAPMPLQRRKTNCKPLVRTTSNLLTTLGGLWFTHRIFSAFKAWAGLSYDLGPISSQRCARFDQPVKSTPDQLLQSCNQIFDLHVSKGMMWWLQVLEYESSANRWTEESCFQGNDLENSRTMISGIPESQLHAYMNLVRM